MKSLRTISLCAVASALLSSSVLFAQHAAPAVRITAPIDPAQLVTLKGTVHPLANAQNDRGAANPSMALDRLHLVFKRSPAQETALRQLIQEQNTPGSASYHQWLTPDQFAAQFGPSQQDIQTVENWLSDQGFTINKVEPGNQALEVSGTVGLLQSAFHTQIRKYAVNGQIHYANANDPQIPAALAPVVGGFVSLNNFHYHSYAQKLGEATYDPSTGQAKPSWTIGSGSGYQNLNFVLSPADYAVQYDIPSTLKGDGQTIAIINESNINIGLVNQFRSLFGLPANPPQVVIDGNDPGVDGMNNPDGPNGASVEAYLDVEWAGAVAPDATIDLVIAGDTSLESGLALAAEHAVYSNIAPVISISFGQCELIDGSSNLFWNALWQQAAAQGQTVLVSTGDSGSAGCDASGSEYATGGQAVNGIASTPWDVAVGGTDFFYSQWNQGASAIDTQLGTYWNTTASNSTPSVSIKGYIPEQPWNSSQYGLDLFNSYTESGNTSTIVVGGGGGASNAAVCPGNSYGSNGRCTLTPSGYPKPAWQTGVSGIPSDNVRDLPDVSLFASNGYNDSYYPICATDADCQPAGAGGFVQIFGVGGTSASTPAFAGIMALVNQKYGRQGQADTILYPLKAQFPAAFHDITNGNISMPCAYSATANLNSPNCIQIAGTNYVTIQSSSGASVQEGQIGTGTTVEYNAGAGYNLATGLGSVDAAALINDWGQVKLGASSVTLTATPTSFTHGQPIKFSGTVSGSGTPTGNVAIMTDSTETSQQGQLNFALSNGSYTSDTNDPSGVTTLPGGQYNVWASYGGDAKNAASVSQKTLINVAPENSGIAFGLFQDTNIYSGTGTYQTANLTTNVDYGTQLVLSARVAPAGDVATIQACTPQGSSTKCPTYTSPTGTIAFKDSSSTLNTAVINSEGDAEFNAPFSVGAHSVSASYSGDSSYNSSTSSAITFTVVKDTPDIGVGASNYDQGLGGYLGEPGQPTIVTVQVENHAIVSSASASATFPVPVAAPTGSVSVTGLPAGVATSANLVSATDPTTGGPEGVATFTIPAGTYGNFTIGVTYKPGSDPNYNTATSTGNALDIINIPNTYQGFSSTTAATATGGISPNSEIVINGTVTGQNGQGVPTGSVYVYSSGYFLTGTSLSKGSGIVANFQIVLNSQTLSQGANFLVIQYFGDQTYFPSAVTIPIGNPLNNPLADFSLAAQNDLVPLTAGGSAGTATIGLSSINNFAGPVNLTCSAAPGVTCSMNPASVSLSAGASATTTVNISASSGAANTTYNVGVVGTDSSGEYVHTANVQAVVTGSAAGSSSFGLSASPANLAFVPAASSGNSTTITVAPIGTGQYSGTIDMSCSVTPAGSGSPTCLMSNASVALNGSASPFTGQTDGLTVNSTSSTTAGAYTVTVTGHDSSTNISSTTTVQVSIGDFALAKSGDITLKAGATTGNTSMITVTPQGSFAGTVNLSCSFTSNAASDPATCLMNPASVALTGSNAPTSTLSITTTAATAMNDQKPVFWPTAGGGAVLACALFFWIPKKRRSWLALVVLLVFVLSLGGMACGGGGGGGNGGGGGGGGNPGTTAGTYSVTVTATSGSLTHTQTVSLTVQ